MPNKNQELARSISGIIRQSVTNTIATLFNVSVNASEDVHKVPSGDDFVCCGELVQDDARATLMFLFDRELIERLLGCVFSASELIDDTAIYESAALEIVNIVGNNLKMYLNVHGYKLNMSIPYVPDREGQAPAEEPLVQMTFSAKNSAVMGVDFYLRRA